MKPHKAPELVRGAAFTILVTKCCVINGLLPL